MDWAAVIIYSVLNIWLQVLLFHWFSWWMIPMTVLAYVITDLAAGTLHWLCDTYGTPSTPILGGFIRPFREHHTNPLIITQHGFIEANGSSCLVVIPILMLAIWISALSPLTATLLSGIAGFSVATNQIHKWAHQDRKGVIRWLQKAHIILSPEMHAKHHTEPHDSHYTITSGIWNYVLGNRFWRRLEFELPFKVQR